MLTNRRSRVRDTGWHEQYAYGSASSASPAVHDTIYKKTGNHRASHPRHRRACCCTVGAKTGIQHTASYAEDGGSYLVVASKGGDPKAPGWYFDVSN